MPKGKILPAQSKKGSESAGGKSRGGIKNLSITRHLRRSKGFRVITITMEV